MRHTLRRLLPCDLIALRNRRSATPATRARITRRPGSRSSFRHAQR
jgi:hypothetical protein